MKSANLITLCTSQINPYVNGALYSLLGNKEINIVAQDMDIENKIIEKCQVRSLESGWSVKLITYA